MDNRDQLDHEIKIQQIENLKLDANILIIVAICGVLFGTWLAFL